MTTRTSSWCRAAPCLLALVLAACGGASTGDAPPLGGGIGRIMRFGSQPVNMQLQGFYNVVRPDAVGEWTIRFQIQLLFPTG